MYVGVINMGIKQKNVIIACNSDSGCGTCYYASFDSLFELDIIRCTKQLGGCPSYYQVVLDKEKQRKKHNKKISLEE